jgi:hypothetical protein
MAPEAGLTRTFDSTPVCPPDAQNAPAGRQRLRLVVLQETPGIWLVRGLEHDVSVEARSIGQALRSAIGAIEAHTAFDRRHGLSPLSAFPAAPQSYWNAYNAGTLISLAQLGIVPLNGWEVSASISRRRP